MPNTEVLHQRSSQQPTLDTLWAIEAGNRLAAYQTVEVKAIPRAEVLAKYAGPSFNI